ncbi:MAG: TetR/AcrR family transcriptional regulator [Limnochordia bacterium]|nr:TetR/AcrR family transcriptional regulator [Limnochordia bacterium]
MINDLQKEKWYRILDAAQSVFAQKGFHYSTVEEIAEKAGVGKGTVYLYFRSKEEILNCLITTRMNDLNEKIQATTLQGTNTLDRIRRAITACFEFCHEYREFVILLYGQLGLLAEYIPNDDQLVGDSILLVEEIMEHAAEDEIRWRCDTGILSAALRGILRTTLLEWAINRNTEPPQKAADEIFRLFCYGAVASVKDE